MVALSSVSLTLTPNMEYPQIEQWMGGYIVRLSDKSTDCVRGDNSTGMGFKFWKTRRGAEKYITKKLSN